MKLILVAVADDRMELGAKGWRLPKGGSLWTALETLPVSATPEQLAAARDRCLFEIRNALSDIPEDL